MIKLDIQMFGGRGAKSSSTREKELKSRLGVIKRTERRLTNKYIMSTGETKSQAKQYLNDIQQDRAKIEKELEKIKEKRMERFR